MLHQKRKSWLQDNDMYEMYSTDNGRKSIVAKRFIRSLINKIYKCIFQYKKIVYW